MANIQTFLDKIKSAIYGEEVRGSIVNAIEAMNEESSSAEQNTSTIISKINASTASATGTDQGTSPTASFVDRGTKFEFIFTIPKGDTGPQGPKGDIGPKGDTPPLSNITPSSLGTASPGTGNNASREDHIHPMPTADDIRYDTNTSVKQVVGSMEETMNGIKEDVDTLQKLGLQIVDGQIYQGYKEV